MKNEIAFALMLISCGSGVLLGRALPRDPARDARPVAGTAPSVTFHPGRQPSCDLMRAELAQTKAELAFCMAFAPHDLPVEPPADTAVEAQGAPPAETAEETPEEYAKRDAARVHRNMDALKMPGELIIVRHADHTVGIYPADQQIDGAIIVARRLPSGEIAYYDPDAGPRTDPSAFRVPPPGSPLAPPKMEVGPDGLIYINGKLAHPAVQKFFGGSPR
jgi:hypothetical protein